MAKIKEIIEAIEQAAPIETQEEWDNSGWQINLGNKNTDKILVCLNVTEETVEQAVKNNCDLIISHHPLIFSPLKCIKNKAIIKAVQNNIQVYSAHTNFDKSSVGTTEKLAEILGFGNLKEINEFVKYTIIETLKTENLLKLLKEKLNLKTIKAANNGGFTKISRIALCAGSGASFIQDLKPYNIDCYITSDIKYHEALESKVLLLDVGHFESEVIALDNIRKIIENHGAEIVMSKEEPVFEIL